jgi:hypothetical protein
MEVVVLRGVTVKNDWFMARFTMDSNMMHSLNMICCFFRAERGMRRCRIICGYCCNIHGYIVIVYGGRYKGEVI